MKKWNTRSMGDLMAREEGKIGYLIAWLLGVPASVLLVIALFRG